MEEIIRIIEVLGSFSWPIVVLVVIFLFRDSIKKMLCSTRWGKVKVKIGGQELTIEEAADQQGRLISDLQRNVLESNLKKKSSNEMKKLLVMKGDTNVGVTVSNRLLWVDDKPRNNSYLIRSLMDFGVDVDIALSTDDALKKIAKMQYPMILSDMGRKEHGVINNIAGLDLLRELHKRKRNIPFVIFTTGRNAQKFGREAKSRGAVAITSSSSKLILVISKYLKIKEVV